MELIADASLVLAVILGEEEKSEIIAKSTGYDLVSPACLRWEIGNAFSACMKRKRFQREQLEIAWNAFETIPIKLSDVNIRQSLKIAEYFNLYAYDSYYLQCALTHKLPLFSLDKRMREVGKELNIKTIKV